MGHTARPELCMHVLRFATETAQSKGILNHVEQTSTPLGLAAPSAALSAAESDVHLPPSKLPRRSEEGIVAAKASSCDWLSGLHLMDDHDECSDASDPDFEAASNSSTSCVWSQDAAVCPEQSNKAPSVNLPGCLDQPPPLQHMWSVDDSFAVPDGLFVSSPLLGNESLGTNAPDQASFC